MIDWDRFPLFGSWRDDETLVGAVVLLRDREGRFLLQLRDTRPNLRASGQWSLFGGGHEPGEDLAETACREAREETGLALSPDALTPFARFVSPNQPPLRVGVFLCTEPIDISQIRLGEGAGYALMTQEQVSQYPVSPVYRDIVLQAFAKIPPANDGISAVARNRPGS